jgi:hypothetical protein
MNTPHLTPVYVPVQAPAHDDEATQVMQQGPDDRRIGDARTVMSPAGQEATLQIADVRNEAPGTGPITLVNPRLQSARYLDVGDSSDAIDKLPRRDAKKARWLIAAAIAGIAVAGLFTAWVLAGSGLAGGDPPGDVSGNPLPAAATSGNPGALAPAHAAALAIFDGVAEADCSTNNPQSKTCVKLESQPSEIDAGIAVRRLHRCTTRGGWFPGRVRQGCER